MRGPPETAQNGLESYSTENPPLPRNAPPEGAEPDVGAGVGELAVEAAGAAQPGPEVEAVLVVGAMAGAADATTHSG